MQLDSARGDLHPPYPINTGPESRESVAGGRRTTCPLNVDINRYFKETLTLLFPFPLFFLDASMAVSIGPSIAGASAEDPRAHPLQSTQEKPKPDGEMRRTSDRCASTDEDTRGVQQSEGEGAELERRKTSTASGAQRGFHEFSKDMQVGPLA